jgi:hypothetical protein
LKQWSVDGALSPSLGHQPRLADAQAALSTARYGCGGLACGKISRYDGVRNSGTALLV